MKYRLAISPCPNDTYIFGPLILGKLGDVISDVNYLDISELNTLALNGNFDFCKVSFYNYCKNLIKHPLLSCGGAMGYGVGPLLLKKNEDYPAFKVTTLRVGLPGELTTANFLFNFFIKNHDYYDSLHIEKIYLPFDQIENAIQSNEIDYGVVIHESRFTFKEKGLDLIFDLGDFWTSSTHSPIPLGAIIGNAKLTQSDIQHFEELIQQSIKYSEEHTSEMMPFILKHSGDLREEIVKKHIDLYVNEFSLKMGVSGEKAVSLMQTYCD